MVIVSCTNMKKWREQGMRKAAVWIGMVMVMLLSACSAEPPKLSADSFSFSVIDPETEISAGKEVGFTAQLSNLSDHDVVLSHGDPLIVLYLCSAEDEAEEGVGAVLAQTAMKAHEQIEKETFIRVEEAGDYRLRAYCAFSIGGEEYRYECEDIPIKVTDAQSAE